MKKDKDNKKFYFDLYESASIGFSVVLSVIIGGAIGLWIDKKFPSTHPWGFLIFLFFGIVAGFENMYKGYKRFKDNEHNNKKT